MSVRDPVRFARPPAAPRLMVRLGRTRMANNPARFSDVGRLLFWDTLAQDVRFACRLFVRTPLLTTAIAATLALGIGAASAIFGLVNAVVLRPLPYAEPDRLVQMYASGPGLNPSEADWVSFPNFRDWQRLADVVDGMAAYRYELFTLAGGQGPESMVGLEVTDRLFSVLGVQPALGRTFAPGEDTPGRRHVVIISHALWQRQFGGDRSVIGRGIPINSETYTIVGVMPPTFRFPHGLPGQTTAATSIDLWLPIRPAPDLEQRGSLNYWAIARLKPNATLAHARVAMTTIAATLAREYPATNKDLGVTVVLLRDHTAGSARLALLALLGAVGLALLLTCANVAGLLLSRAEARTREMAMRQALGGSRARLVRQTLTESVLLALVGGMAGVAVAQAGVRLLVRFAPPAIPRLEQTVVDNAVLAFIAIVAVCMGILFGLAPALLGWRDNVSDMLRHAGARTSTGAGGRRLRQALVAGQLAMAVMLLTGAGLLVRSFVRVANLELGFRAPNVLITFVQLSGSRYDMPERQAEFYSALVERIEALPGVAAAAVSNSVPLTGINDQGSVRIEGLILPRGQDAPNGNRPHISPHYFDALGIRLLEGRLFDERDRRDTAPVAIVSELAARTYWPDGAIGRRLAIEQTADGPAWREVIGVVQSTRHFGIEAPQKAEFYVPQAQAASPFMQLVVRTDGDPLTVAPAVRKAVATLDPEQTVVGFDTMEQLLNGSVAQRRFQTALVTLFASMALLLAAIGVYAAMSHMVGHRKREIGVRLALGARPSEVVTLILRNGFMITVVGAAAGLAGAAMISQLLAGLLYGVSPLDLATYAGVTTILLVVAILAAYVPSRAAGQVDPLVILSDE
jgi:putative ABC transport system permease protein